MGIDGKIDYSGYSRTELREAWSTIDHEKFPQNSARLRQELERRDPRSLHKSGEEIARESRPPAFGADADVYTRALDRSLGTWKEKPKGSLFNKLSFVRDAVARIPGLVDRKPPFDEGAQVFSGRVGYALRLMFSEPEMIVFGLLQWAVIGLGYYLWLQMLYWIPEEVWRSARDSKGTSPADLVLWLWSFLCVGLVALPLGVLVACTGVVAVLRRSGADSTIAACLRIASPQVFRLWLFTWIDGWITVTRILERLPRKERESAAARLRNETLYYAWKLGSAGVLPAMIMGKGVADAGVESIRLLRNRLKDVLLLRVGYSTFCWLVGVAAYVGAILLFRYFPDLIPRNEPFERHVGDVYYWAGIPLLVAVGIIVMLLRPIYLISLCTLYVEEIRSRGESVTIPHAPSRLASGLVALAAMFLIVGTIFLYRDELGISAMLETTFK